MDRERETSPKSGMFLFSARFRIPIVRLVRVSKFNVRAETKKRSNDCFSRVQGKNV